MPAAKPNGLSSFNLDPRGGRETHMMEEEKQLLPTNCPLTSMNVPWHMHTHTLKHTHAPQIKCEKVSICHCLVRREVIEKQNKTKIEK